MSQSYTSSECFKSAGCSWCSRAENFTPLSEEYCTSRRDCYFGIKENHPPNSNKKGIYTTNRQLKSVHT